MSLISHQFNVYGRLRKKSRMVKFVYLISKPAHAYNGIDMLDVKMDELVVFAFYLEGYIATWVEETLLVRAECLRQYNEVVHSAQWWYRALMGVIKDFAYLCSPK
jgi:hypothetical protein